jgi:hypothetical protein
VADAAMAEASEVDPDLALGMSFSLYSVSTGLVSTHSNWLMLLIKKLLILLEENASSLCTCPFKVPVCILSA